MKNSLPLVVTVAFSVVGVVGDYLLKLASEQRAPLRSGWFYLGFVVYASTAFGWVYVMRHLKLATIGAVYSVSMILLLTGVGVAAFRQPLNAYEVAGLAYVAQFVADFAQKRRRHSDFSRVFRSESGLRSM
jgi:multidrug transporter EmrE-like cation transporter